MTKNEMVQIMAILTAAYPHFYDKQTETDKMATLRLWNRHFEYIDYSIMLQAVDAIVARNKFSPTIAEIYEKLDVVLGIDSITEADAWSCVLKAISSGTQDFQHTFELLPPIVRDSIGSAEKLKEWAGLSEPILEMVISSEFYRAFRRERERRTKLMELPQGRRFYLQKQQGYVLNSKQNSLKHFGELRELAESSGNTA